MTSHSKSPTLTILPLPRGVVLLPGVTLRIPVSDALPVLRSIATRSKTPKPEASDVPIGCVPLRSSLLSGDGQQLIEGQSPPSPHHLDKDDGQDGFVSRKDLFNYGVVAKISGLYKGRRNDLSLTVEGLSRFRIAKITKERPYVEAMVNHLQDEGTIAIDLHLAFAVANHSCQQWTQTTLKRKTSSSSSSKSLERSSGFYKHHHSH